MHVCTIYDDFSMLCRKVNILSKRKKKWHVLPFHDCHLHCNYCQKEFAAIMKLHSLRVSNDYFYLYCPPLDAFIHGNAAPPTNMTINHHQIYPASDNVASPGDYIALKTPSHGFVVGGSWGITFFKLFQHSNMCLRLRTRTRIQRFACVGGLEKQLFQILHHGSYNSHCRYQPYTHSVVNCRNVWSVVLRQPEVFAWLVLKNLLLMNRWAEICSLAKIA